jgi:hypothetical protein
LLNRAQCGQLAEAYSITVTLALAAPRLMSSLATLLLLPLHAAKAKAMAATMMKLTCERRMGVFLCDQPAVPGGELSAILPAPPIDG